MSLENFRKYISTNLISLCGYIVFIISMKYLFFDIPRAMELDKIEQIHEGLTHTFMDATIPYFVNYIYCLLVIILFLILWGIEYHFLNSNKLKPVKFLENQNKFKSIIFWLGYILIPFPIYIEIVLFVIFNIKMLIWTFTR